MNLVFLIAIVVEDFSNQRTPHQLRVSMFDLKPEENDKDRMRKGYDGDCRLLCFLTRRTKKFSKAYQRAVSKTSTSDQQMSQEGLCVLRPILD